VVEHPCRNREIESAVIERKITDDLARIWLVTSV
jgi:hypothetical protein